MCIRDRNDWSYKYTRRQWSLVDHPDLKYRELEAFDEAMMSIADKVFAASGAKMLNLDQLNQCIQFERGDLIFAVNLSPSISVVDYEFPVQQEGSYRLILSSDDPAFGGANRADSSIDYPAVEGRVKIYSPSRTILVFARKD